MAGVSTRRVDDLVRAIDIPGLSKSEVSRMCSALDAEVEAFRARPLDDVAFPYLWLDATYLRVREAGRVVSMAALVATGVASTGERRVLGLELAAGNDEGSAWPRFVRSLVERGLHGVRLVISDDQPPELPRRGICGQHDDGYRARCRIGTKSLEDLKAREVGQVEIHQNEMGTVARARIPARPRPAGQECLRQAQARGIVFDVQDDALGAGG